ncbi:hypothetical protein [Jiangella asiatica]|uniref:Uncharacterized protein n=1 Tax=Jiangella asiatica TaxID=2530372 RepID=A0A4R5DIR2_9ACTN|nr:hypothetical protein [Jiangella asiatica]TDE10665.1 hypothetical protein E1269_11365 [Jiangella asiatica]
MTQSSDPQKCTGARWCDEPAGHRGRHRHYVGEVMLDRTSSVTSVAVTVESATSAPALVLTVAASRPARYHAAPLDWGQVGELAGLLADAHGRWAR